jgi:GH25 family lysozyme M1 (1,4-beta-N-acetylmuramidase)
MNLKKDRCLPVRIILMASFVLLITFFMHGVRVQAAEDVDVYMGITYDDQQDVGGFISHESQKNASIRSSKYIQREGIDVSHWQNDINWDEVKACGKEFVIINCGGRGTSTGKLYTDQTFEKNYSGAKKAGLKVGVYFFSQALSPQEAQEEASYVSKLLSGKQIDLPVFMDYEWTTGYRLANGGDADQRTATIEAFCDAIRGFGYCPGFYTNDNNALYYVHADQLSLFYKMWIAHYPNSVYTHGDQAGDKVFPSCPGNVDFWQYMSRGRVNGISGDVDCDIWFDDGTVSGLNYSPVFDAEYYASHNPDVVKVYGENPSALLSHFINNGMKEGRQGKDSFEVFSYRSRYQDLRGTYGNDLKEYYYHYMKYGYLEGRDGSPLPLSPDKNGFIKVFRLYNPDSGEHLYTTDSNEVQSLIKNNWGTFEGTKWESPASQISGSTPIYRVFNPVSGEHLFTGDENEVKILVNQHGWRDENICWYSFGSTAIYRVFNPTSGEHIYTGDANEKDFLIKKNSWKDEGISWYGN